MAVLLIFLLGIGNFALHKAVIESGHPMIANTPLFARKIGVRLSLLLEFLVLLAALLLVANGFPTWGWAYAGYSVLNGIAAWLILSHDL